MVGQFRVNIISSLAARHTKNLSHFSRFYHYTQPCKNEGRRMSLIMRISKEKNKHGQH